MFKHAQHRKNTMAHWWTLQLIERSARAQWSAAQILAHITCQPELSNSTRSKLWMACHLICVESYFKRRPANQLQAVWWLLGLERKGTLYICKIWYFMWTYQVAVLHVSARKCQWSPKPALRVLHRRRRRSEGRCLPGKTLVLCYPTRRTEWFLLHIVPQEALGPKIPFC